MDASEDTATPNAGDVASSPGTLLGPVDPGSGEEPGAPAGGSPGEAIRTPTARAKLALILFLLIFTVLGLVLAHFQFEKLPGMSVTSVSWKAPENFALMADKFPQIRYDGEKAHLQWKGGPIDAETKTKLLGLGPAEANPADQRTYSNAINDLAFMSGETAARYLRQLLLLGVIAGVLGVTLRSIHDFVRVACGFEKNRHLDLGVWWVWYVARPLQGAIVGALVIVLARTSLLEVGSDIGSADDLWWIGLAVLAGFGALDFAQRLRLLTKSLFGVGGDNER